MQRKYENHYEKSIVISADAQQVFQYTDQQTNLSSHMNKPSWMMGGGSMKTEIDGGKFKEIGSHLRMEGKILGIHLFLDEIVIRRDPPLTKEWETVGHINLLVIDHYKLGFKIESKNSNSNFTVFIDYNYSKRHPILSRVFGKMYAKWCVVQMLNTVKTKFNKD